MGFGFSRWFATYRMNPEPFFGKSKPHQQNLQPSRSRPVRWAGRLHGTILTVIFWDDAILGTQIVPLRMCPEVGRPPTLGTKSIQMRLPW